MSRSKKGSKGCGYEYWSKRDKPSAYGDPSPENKKLTSRRERRKGKTALKANNKSAISKSADKTKSPPVIDQP
jgi:hypothetical protein